MKSYLREFVNDLGREIRSRRVGAIPGTARRGCARCGFWTGPHYRWFMATRELHRHIRKAHK